MTEPSGGRGVFAADEGGESEGESEGEGHMERSVGMRERRSDGGDEKAVRRHSAACHRSRGWRSQEESLKEGGPSLDLEL
eukprot:101163-Rhodomonas_salina.1